MVDLDGTLTPLDSLIETATTLLFRKPARAIFLFVQSAVRGRAWLKAELDYEVDSDLSATPYNQDVLDLIEARRSAGARVVLATGAAEAIASKHHANVELFDEFFSSTKDLNFTGERKAKFLVDQFGERGFDYVGNSRADLEVWKYAHTAYVVSKSRILSRTAANRSIKVAVLRSKTSKIRLILKEIRPHQWVKNLLVLVPFALSHEKLTASSVRELFLAFAAFSLVASSVYVINDLFDRDNDRKHKSKRFRPIASGLMTIPEAFLLAFIVLAIGIAAGFVVSVAYLAFLGIYFLLTCIYTFWGKRKVVLDVVLLAILYTSRIFGGMIALDLNFSFWLFSFSIFTFLSLAYLKRFSELHATKSEDEKQPQLPGRGYRAADEFSVLAMGIASAYTAALILALYLNSQEVATMYAHPNYLWFMLPVFIYWISRIWILGSRGLVDSDPVLFAVRDRTTYLVAIMALIILILSANGELFA